MEVVVVGTDSRYVAVVKELRQRGMKVIMVPGDTLVIYKVGPHTGFQELDGDVAEHYISSLLEE